MMKCTSLSLRLDYVCLTLDFRQGAMRILEGVEQAREKLGQETTSGNVDMDAKAPFRGGN
jgi:hypothetical protein